MIIQQPFFVLCPFIIFQHLLKQSNLQYKKHPAVVPLKDKDKGFIQDMTSSIQIRLEINIFALVYRFYGYACLADTLATVLVLVLFYSICDPWTRVRHSVYHLPGELPKVPKSRCVFCVLSLFFSGRYLFSHES